VGGGGSRAQIPHACICIQICQLGVAAQTLTHPETGPAKFVSKQHHIGTAPVGCTAKFYRRPGRYTPAPCPGSYEPAQGLVPGQEPAPSYPPVSSPPEFQSLGSPETTEKELGTAFPKRVRLGNMLGKVYRVGRIAALVVRRARAVPLGIKHNLRRVGGLCAPNRTSAPALPRTSEPAARSGVDGGSSVARALPQLRKPTRVRLAAFLAVLDGSKTRRAEKIFFRKKNGHMANLASRRAQKWANFFFTWYQNLPPGKVTGKGSETRALRIFTTFGPSEVQIW